MSTPTDWSSRPVLSALSPTELAGMVDTAVSRTEGMLFTATPAEELDAIGQWQRTKDLAFAGMMREIVAAYNRARAKAREFAADEIGLAVGATTTTGGNLLAQALSLGALAGLLESVESGLLTERHVLAVLRELDKVELTIEQRQCVVLVMLAKYRGEAPGELGRLVAKLIVQVDLAAAALRDAKATGERRVRFSRDVDGQAILTARGPAATIAAIRASLEATLPLHPDPDDERSQDVREFDLFVDLLTGGAHNGSWHAEVIVPFSTAQGGDLELAEIPGLGPILPSTARDLLGQCDSIAQTAVDQYGQVIAASGPVRVQREPADNVPVPEQAEPWPDEQWTDEPPEPSADEQRWADEAPWPDEEPWNGEEPAAEPTELVEEPAPAEPPGKTPGLETWLMRWLATPPELRDLTGSGYVFPPRLRRYLEARDRTCVFPGCNRPANRTDKDHRKPWPAGKTSARNGQCLCRRHHRAKQAVFTVLLDTDGSYIWITRGGWQFRRRSKGF